MLCWEGKISLQGVDLWCSGKRAVPVSLRGSWPLGRSTGRVRSFKVLSSLSNVRTR